jgi:hypothetical protein
VTGWLFDGHLGFMTEDDKLFDIVLGINHGKYVMTFSTIPIVCQGISVRRLHLSYLAIYHQIAKNLPLATPCNFCFPECRKAHLNLNPLDSNFWSLQPF